MKWDWNLILMSYGKDFMTYRRVVQQEFQPSTVSHLYRPIMAAEVAALLDRLLTSPEDLIQHFRLCVHQPSASSRRSSDYLRQHGRGNHHDGDIWSQSRLR